MRYTIEIHEDEDANGTPFWDVLEEMDGCNVAGNTLDEFYRKAPEVLQAVIESENESGASHPLLTSIEFRLLVNV